MLPSRPNRPMCHRRDSGTADNFIAQILVKVSAKAVNAMRHKMRPSRTRLLLVLGMIQTCIASVIVAVPAQLQSSVPYEPFMERLFSIKETSYVYPSTYRSLRAIDFGNFSIHIGGDPPDVLLKRGKYV